MAQSHDRIPSEDGVLSAGPYYNPSSKSYFELRRKNNITWDQAALAVKMLKYKNISGRLATIANPSTHSFLVKKFTFSENTWLGLQLFCKDLTLKWSDGSSPHTNNFSNWNETIEKVTYHCEKVDYISAYIKSNSYKWKLGDTDKRSNFYLVEYSIETK